MIKWESLLSDVDLRPVKILKVAEPLLRQTIVFDTYWRFAAERQALYLRRLSGAHAPWTADSILRSYRFTNAYRAADRVSQYLISEVQYRSDRLQSTDEVVFRTLLFKIFNRIETWELLERSLGRMSWRSANREAVCDVLNDAFRRGQRLYSAAYIMPSPALGEKRKHANHLALLWQMMSDGLASQVEKAKSLSEVYGLILSYQSMGPFLAFQFAVDLNYSPVLDFTEANFVVAGPGALDGIAKCFEDVDGRSPAQIIHWMTEHQAEEFAKRGLEFPGLFGRPLQPIDCQNLFCEISKYARVAHPTVAGISGRTRIKQAYQPKRNTLMPPVFPPRWNLNVPVGLAISNPAGQLSLF